MHAFIAGLSISILFAGTAYAQDGARIRTEVHSPSGLVVDQAGVVRQAFGGLQRGDASAVIRMLDPAVRWHVTRMREFTDANDLDLQGATRFLERLAAAIRS